MLFMVISIRARHPYTLVYVRKDLQHQDAFVGGTSSAGPVQILCTTATGRIFVPPLVENASIGK